MNIKKFLVASGAMALAAAAVFAGVKKFNGPITTIFYTINKVCHSFVVASTTTNFTTGGTGTQATIKTKNGVDHPFLWGYCDCRIGDVYLLIPFISTLDEMVDSE